jgi:Arm DNA-binding domain
VKLSVKTTAGVKLEGRTERIVFDDDIKGFGLRLREGGSRTWIYQYRIGSKQRRMVLGAAAETASVQAVQRYARSRARPPPNLAARRSGARRIGLRLSQRRPWRRPIHRRRANAKGRQVGGRH